MRQRAFLSFFLLLAATLTSAASAVSVCQNNVCGRIVCHFGCVQRAVNGVCVENRCTGPRGSVSDATGVVEESTAVESATATPAPWETESHPADARCVSCSGSCCASGPSFLSAERACKARCGSFGCFTRC